MAHMNVEFTTIFPHLQPENLLLYRKGSLEIKIVDFGLAVQLQEGQEVKSLVGTAEYVCKLHLILFCC